MTEIRQLRDFYSKHKHFFIVVKRRDSEELAKKERVFFLEDIKNNISALARNFIVAWNVFSDEEPDVLISTGAGAALPVIFAAKSRGIKIIFLESLARVSSLSATGRFVYKIADLFLVQWPDLTKKHPKAKFWGAVV